MGKFASVILVGLVAILLRALLPKTLPHPYEAIPIQPLAPERVARMHQALNFSQSEEWLNKTETRPLKNNLEILFNGTVLGAESVGIRPVSNQLVMLDKFGYMHHAQPSGEYLVNNKDTSPPYLGPGRPLGFEFLDKDTLIVADSLKGLVQVKFLDPKQDIPSQNDVEVSILTNTVNGTSINYVNDLDIDHRHQRVYFTSSTTGTVAYNAHEDEGYYDTLRSYLLNMYSADVSGRLFMYNLKTRETKVLMDDIWYANGVTLSPKLDYVLVVETCGFRVIRKWLKGKKNGMQDDFITNLPGFPDGITRSSDGKHYWISLVAPISPLVKFMEPIGARYIMSLLNFELDVTKHFLKQWACVIKVSKEGAIVDVLIDPDGSTVSTVSAVTEHDGKLFLGNLGGNFVSVYDLSAAS